MDLNRRTFLLSTAILSLVRPDLLFANDDVICDARATAVPGTFAGKTLSFAASNDVGFGGFFGARYAKSLKRLSEEPIDKVDFILADVNFNQDRRFTNYSGDISGRYIEVASLTSRKDKPTTPILEQVIDEIVQYQKPDGHFGRDVDWEKTVDIAGATDRSLEMPILWGNGRLMLGLFAAYERFGNEKAYEAAKKMADFYVNIVAKRFCDPNRMEEYSQQAAGYAAAYVTCVFHGIEGLVRAYRLTGDRKYLDTAIEMADFHEQFDTLPVGHSHGSISTHEALVLLYEVTGEKKYLNRVLNRWNAATTGGYIHPAGGVAEQYVVSYKSDEGCSEADWLRLNLMLWRNTGDKKYIDFAERMLFNAYQANQWDTGGFGHRYLGTDERGAFAWGKRYAESYWCCSYHGPLGYYELKEFFAVGAADEDGGNKMIYYNFPLEFNTPIMFGDEKWEIVSRPVENGNRSQIVAGVKVNGPEGGKVAFAIRFPDWAKSVSTDVAGYAKLENGYWILPSVDAGTEIQITFNFVPILEDRRFRTVEAPCLKTGETVEVDECVLRYGPNVLVTKKETSAAIENLNLKIDDDGVIQIPDSLTSIYDMSDTDRDGEHVFVFNVRFSK